jgi:tetratricopeptide (TPR) repeat protein
MHALALPIFVIMLIIQLVLVDREEKTMFRPQENAAPYFWVISDLGEELPGSVQELNQEAVEALEANEYQRARTLLLQSLQSLPDQPSATNNLGVAEIHLGNHIEGIEHIRRSFKLASYTHPEASANNALYNLLTGEPKLALVASQFVLDRNPDDLSRLSVLITRALAYKELHKCDSAKLQLQEIELNQTPLQQSLENNILLLEAELNDCSGLSEPLAFR